MNEDYNNLNIQPYVQPFDYSGQKNETSDFLSKYASYIPKITGQIESQLNLPQLRELQGGLAESISGLKNQIYNVPNIVKGTSTQSLVTAPQMQQLTTKMQQPLNENLTRQAEAASALSSQITNAENLANTMINRSLLPFEKEYSSMETMQAREYSGYTTANQLELDRLIANLNAGVTLTNAEKNRLNELALAEKNYQFALGQIKATGEQTRLTRDTDTNALFTALFG